MKTLRHLALATLVTLAHLSPDALAYPEMVRHGYPNCTTCHISPTGGGVLTDYGRELSREVLAWKGGEKEAMFAYGLVKLPEGLAMGGDVRSVQVLIDNPRVTEAEFIFMQADLELAYTWRQYTLAGTFGVAPHYGPLSRRHYLMVRPMDELMLRIGRFLPAYGINTPEHTLFIRGRGLNFNDQGSESYNAEVSYLGEKINLHLTAAFGRPKGEDEMAELESQSFPARGIGVTASYSFEDKHKVGLSYFNDRQNFFKRHLLGPFAILGFTPHFFLLSEFDWQILDPDAGSVERGFAYYTRLNYEFIQGFHAYLFHQQARLSFPQSGVPAYGIGAQAFPRPHFEIQAEWQKQHLPAFTSAVDVASVLLHFYL